jgi:threonine synthase
LPGRSLPRPHHHSHYTFSIDALTRGQDIVKQIFSDEKFNTHFHLGAVNSINWARILAQITYYFHSHFSFLHQQEQHRPTTGTTDTPPYVQYVVPTGNFGDILAGYYAKKMGLPISKLIVATNENDILDRFFRGGRYEKHPLVGREGEMLDGVKAHVEGVKETLSPAMDILVSSNFERLLWYLAGECETSGTVEDKQKKAGEIVKGWMSELKNCGGMVVSQAVLDAAKRDFASFRVSDKEVLSPTPCEGDSNVGAVDIGDNWGSL